MKEIFLILLFIGIMFIIAEFGATVLVSFIDFSNSDEEKEHITRDVFFVRIKRNVNASYESGFDSVGFKSLEDAEAYIKDLIQDGIPEENIKIEKKER